MEKSHLRASFSSHCSQIEFVMVDFQIVGIRLLPRDTRAEEVLSVSCKLCKGDFSVVFVPCSHTDLYTDLCDIMVNLVSHPCHKALCFTVQDTMALGFFWQQCSLRETMTT